MPKKRVKSGKKRAAARPKRAKARAKGKAKPAKPVPSAPAKAKMPKEERELQAMAERMHSYERKDLLSLQTGKKTVTQLCKETGLKDIAVIRGLQWLQNKKLVTIMDVIKEVVVLLDNGKRYKQEGLPERKLLEAIMQKPLSLKQAQDKAGLSSEELSGSLGALRAKNALLLLKEKELILKITEQGKQLLLKGLPEERLLVQEFPLETAGISGEERAAIAVLRKRKSILTTELKKTRMAESTPLGRKLVQLGLVKDEVLLGQLTPELLRTQGWKNKRFRKYDVAINVPEISAGRLHHYRSFLDGVRNKFVSLGFEEMTGPIVETDFWNMDALFMPQFHSARDIHDAYYVKEPKYGELPKKLVANVKTAHEKGVAGSKGWQYPFDVQRTHRLLLRTQGTACSSRKLAAPDLKIPGKYFGITRCFRHDRIDATHLADFDQCEGIVIGENLTLRHLFGLLRQFAEEFAGTTEVKLVPSYFPFTEPSVELFAKHPKLGWLELGGAGLFRPELVVPLLGKNVSVLAWGLGIARVAMIKLDLTDIRQLYGQDLEFLRNTKLA